MLGWTIGNDMSERTWQRGDRTLWRAKNSDTFKPMGPWIETDFDLDAAETTIRVNGEMADHFSTNNMIHGLAKFISRMSQYLTLYPGDVVWMGTEGAPGNLKHGDIGRDRDHRDRHPEQPGGTRRPVAGRNPVARGPSLASPMRRPAGYEERLFLCFLRKISDVACGNLEREGIANKRTE